jgi:hypothetical protein
MLTTDQKEAILRKAGVAVPEFPSDQVALRRDATYVRAPDRLLGRRQADAPEASRRKAIEQWTAAIDALYVEYTARRAAKSLRDAEEARQLGRLQSEARGPRA